MKNTKETAVSWVNFIAGRPEFTAGTALLAQLDNSVICDLCNCGCNSFNLEREVSSKVVPIAGESEAGKVVFLIEFATEDPSGSLEFILYADEEGNFDGMDVHFNGNTEPMPENVSIIEPPFQVYGELARGSG